MDNNTLFLFFYAGFPEHAFVGFGLSFQAQRVGARAAWHPVKQDATPLEVELRAAAHRRFGHAEAGAERLGGLLSGRCHGAAMGQAAQQGRHVGGADHLEEAVGGVALQAPHGRGGVVEGDAGCLEEGHEAAAIEAPAGDIDEGIAVSPEHQAEDAPHVVREIGVEEIDRPAAPWRREAAQHQEARPGRQEGRQGVVLHGRRGVSDGGTGFSG